MKCLTHFFFTLQRITICYTLLVLATLNAPIFSQVQPIIANSELELPANMELIEENDPLYTTTKQAYSAKFGTPNASIDASPKLEMGPVLRTDGNDNAIVTFKAASGECAQYAFAPTKEALEDRIEIEFISNNRLPDNRKWKADNTDKKLKEAIPRFRFDKSVTAKFNDSGYSSSHGTSLAKDTNHNWGFRLYKDGKLLTKKADYEKYVRHMISSNPTRANLASDITIEEGELLIKWGLADQEFKQQVLDPMLKLAEQIVAAEGPQASAANLEKLCRIMVGTTVIIALLILPIGAWNILGPIAVIKTLVTLNKTAAACDARKPSYQESDLRHVVILAR